MLFKGITKHKSLSLIVKSMHIFPINSMTHNRNGYATIATNKYDQEHAVWKTSQLTTIQRSEENAFFLN